MEKIFSEERMEVLKHDLDTYHQLKDGMPFDWKDYVTKLWQLRGALHNGLHRYLAFIPADWVEYPKDKYGKQWATLVPNAIPFDEQFGFRALRMIPVTSFQHTLLNVMASRWYFPETCIFLDLKELPWVKKPAYYSGKSGNVLYDMSEEMPDLAEAVWNVDDLSYAGLSEEVIDYCHGLPLVNYGFSGDILAVKDILRGWYRAPHLLYLDENEFTKPTTDVMTGVSHAVSSRIESEIWKVCIVGRKPFLKNLWTSYVRTVLPYMLAYFADAVSYESTIADMGVNRYLWAESGMDWSWRHFDWMLNAEEWLVKTVDRDDWQDLLHTAMHEIFHLDVWDSTWLFCK